MDKIPVLLIFKNSQEFFLKMQELGIPKNSMSQLPLILKNSQEFLGILENKFLGILKKFLGIPRLFHKGCFIVFIKYRL